MDPADKYFVKTRRRPTGGSTCDVLDVAVFARDCGSTRKIGEYERNYHSMYETFYPFRQGERELALYSPHYSATRVMSLPDCTDLGGEEPARFGFCPVEYFVPTTKWYEDDDDEDLIDGKFGFVAGCIWGDDSSWKIQYLDLSSAAEGKINRDDRFGYLELANGQSLKHAVDARYYEGDGFTDIGISSLAHYKVHEKDPREHLRRRIAELQRALDALNRKQGSP